MNRYHDPNIFTLSIFYLLQYSRINSMKRNVTIVMNHDYDASSMDALFRIIYFSAFILFNVGYWTYYAISTQHGAKDDD